MAESRGDVYSLNPGSPVVLDCALAPDTNDPDEIYAGFPERDAKCSVILPASVVCDCGRVELTGWMVVCVVVV